MKKVVDAVIIIILLLSLTSIALADTYISGVFPTINSTNINAFQVNGNAAQTGSVLRLTPASNNQAGSAFWKYKTDFPANRSFATYFSFQITSTGGGGADGLVFVIQPDSNTAGSSGGGLGFSGIPNAFGVEFDTYQNGDYGDPNGNHIGIDLSPGGLGSVTSVATVTVDSINSSWSLEDGAIYHTWVEYNGSTQNITIRLNRNNNTRPINAVLNYTTNLSNVFAQQAYVGFTAATGGAYENHDINSFFINNNYLSDGININTTTYQPYAYRLLLSQSHLNVSADGYSVSAITINATDLDGNLLPTQNISFTTTLGNIMPLGDKYASSGLTNSTGQLYPVYASSHLPGTATITASVPGGAYNITTVTFLNSGATVPELSTIALFLIIASVFSGFFYIRTK